MVSINFLLKAFVWFNLRYLKRHYGRTLAVILGIAVGAAVFTSVRLSIHASLESFSRSMDLIAGQADRVILRPGGRIPDALISQLIRHPAINHASPVLSTYVVVEGIDPKPLLLIGIDPILDRMFRTWRSEDLPTTSSTQSKSFWSTIIEIPFSLLLPASVARDNGWQTNDTIILQHVERKTAFKIVGLLHNSDFALAENGQIAITDIATFQEFTGLYGEVDRIDLQIYPEASADDMADLKSILPADVSLSLPSEQKDIGRNLIRAYQLNLSVLSFVSLFVGMFLVYSLVALNAASRRREMAILRSIGASPRLLFVLFLADGLFLGIIGWMVALPISAILVKYLIKGVSQTISTLFVRLSVEQVALAPWELLLSFGITAIISIVAAWQPAREAMQISPLEVLTSRHSTLKFKQFTGRLAIIGLTFIIMVWPLTQLPGIRGFPLPGYAATFFLFVGFALLSPWCLCHIGRLITPLLSKMAGSVEFLAGKYIGNSDTRTAISVGALITAVALFIALVVMIQSFRSTVSLWVQQTVAGDLFVVPKMGQLNRHRYPFPQKAVEAFQNLETRADYVAFRRYPMHRQQIPYQFEAIDFEVFFKHAGFLWIEGVPETVHLRLIKGEGVVVSEVFANRTGLKVGDRLQAAIDTIQIDLPILGIIRDYRTHGGVVYFALDAFEKLRSAYRDRPNARLHQWSGLRFFFTDNHPDIDMLVEDLRKEIVTKCPVPVDMISGRQLRQGILKIFDETFAVTTALLLIALLVATVGIAVTLVVMVLERSRELNTLFAIGSSFGQIQAMIFWEALVIVLIGQFLGWGCGYLLSLILVFVINQQSFGWTFLYHIDWRTLAITLPLIISAALLATLPAIRSVFYKPPASLLREQ